MFTTYFPADRSRDHAENHRVRKASMIAIRSGAKPFRRVASIDPHRRAPSVFSTRQPDADVVILAFFRVLVLEAGFLPFAWPRIDVMLVSHDLDLFNRRLCLDPHAQAGRAGRSDFLSHECAVHPDIELQRFAPTDRERAAAVECLHQGSTREG